MSSHFGRHSSAARHEPPASYPRNVENAPVRWGCTNELSPGLVRCTPRAYACPYVSHSGSEQGPPTGSNRGPSPRQVVSALARQNKLARSTDPW